MKWKRPITLVIIIEAAILLLLPAALTYSTHSTNAQGGEQSRTTGSWLNAKETKTPFISDQLSKEETEIILNESTTFGQILFLYATKALEKPTDLRLCAYEMFRLKPNENSCRDKHSAWYSKEESKLIESDREGKFGGVGLEVSDKDGKVVVISPIDGTPAFRAGFKPEDVIVKIDDKPVLNLMDAVRRMRGKAGASVKITVKRDGREFSVKVVREIITIHAVSAKIISSPQGAIGYIKVKTFSEIMPEEFREKITDFGGKGVNNIILDFRNNPGGLLNSALDILYDFARSGDILIAMRERNKETIFDTEFVAPMLSGQEIFFEGIKVTAMREPGMFRDMKIVVLINKGSASASEVFAGTMKDWGFPVIGSRSFGKGVGQTLIPLIGGSTLRLTTFEFLVGNSKTKINDIGVIPTYEVLDPTPSTSEILRKDHQLEKAIEILSR